MDGNLANKIKGWDVAAILLRQDPAMRIIGFSSETQSNKPFMQAGAEGVVPKEPGFQEESIAALIAHFSSRPVAAE